MTHEKFNSIVKEETDYISNLLTVKQAEYSLDDDALSQFKHAGAMAGWTPEKALFGFMLKHWMSITDMINSGEKFTREKWKEKITDSANYMILLLGLLEDDDMFKEVK